MPTQFQIDDAVVTLARPTPLRTLYIEISSGCNITCPMCFRVAFSGELGPMSDELLDSLIAAFRDPTQLCDLRQVVIAGIGEPFTHPRLLELVAAIRARDVEVLIQSNGLLVDERLVAELSRLGVEKLVISYDDSPTGHPNGDRVLRIARMRRALQLARPHIGVETVVTRANIARLPSFAERALEAGVEEFAITNMLPVTPEMVPHTLALEADDSILDEFLAVVEHRALYRIPKFRIETERHCDFVDRDAMVIRSDGVTAPCYRMLRDGREAGPELAMEVAGWSFGSLAPNGHRETIESIWRRSEYEAFRFRVRHALFPSCPDCSLRGACYFTAHAGSDCWSNEPSCASCLWARRIYLCP